MKERVLGLLLLLSIGAGGAAGEEKRPFKQSLPPPPSFAPTLQQSHHRYNVPMEEKGRKNPVRFTEVSVDRGRRLFQSHCILCHGINADGKGDFARIYGVRPPDFTNPDELREHTDGELFYIIGTGSEKMPGERNKIVEKQRWDIVNYLRAVQGLVPARVMSEREGAKLLKMH